MACGIVLPTNLAVVEDFRAPTCRYCAGQRGIEYAMTAGDPVRAAASGEVSFAGVVGGVRYVVVRTSGGALVTHGELSSVEVQAGDVVAVGEKIGRGGSRLYIGVRVGGRYVDPRHCPAQPKRPRAVLVG